MRIVSSTQRSVGFRQRSTGPGCSAVVVPGAGGRSCGHGGLGTDCCAAAGAAPAISVAAVAATRNWTPLPMRESASDLRVRGNSEPLEVHRAALHSHLQAVRAAAQLLPLLLGPVVEGVEEVVGVQRVVVEEQELGGLDPPRER